MERSDFWDSDLFVLQSGWMRRASSQVWCWSEDAGINQNRERDQNDETIERLLALNPRLYSLVYYLVNPQDNLTK